MSIFVRNSHREGSKPKGSKLEWYSVTLADLVCLHVYTEDGCEWKTKTTGVSSTEGDGFASRAEAESFAMRFAKRRLERALKELEEQECQS